MAIAKLVSEGRITIAHMSEAVTVAEVASWVARLAALDGSGVAEGLAGGDAACLDLVAALEGLKAAAAAAQARVTVAFAASQHEVLAAAEAAEADLAAGLYTSRWHGASPKEQEYLAALAQLLRTQRSAGGADVARALGRTTQQVSYLRDRLIRKGTIFAEAGTLVFAVPGMADWVLSQRV